jgi:hypothetical protein
VIFLPHLPHVQTYSAHDQHAPRIDG